MKIGDEVYIHGYIDEIRSDVIIIRNEGGYFGTVPSEVSCSENPNNCETCKHDSKEWYEDPCGSCCDTHSGYEPKTEPQTERSKRCR